MCGIMGYIGSGDAVRIIVEGLRRLEYRGYDSAGLAVIQEGHLAVRREVGKIDRLEQRLAESPIRGSIGLGHTRWATHGVPCEVNTHPHLDCSATIVVVHNGIVENYAPLKEQLSAAGHTFRSQTDTEVIVHLIEHYVDRDGASLLEAARRAFGELKGAHAIVVLSSREPDRLIAARIGNAGGVTVGYGDQEMFLASDIPALLPHTCRLAFLDSREMVVVTGNGAQYLRLDGTPVTKEVQQIPWDPISAAKGGYKHFMLKEIHEQAITVTDAIRERVDFAGHRVLLPELDHLAEALRRAEKVYSVACGTAWHAALVGKFMIEQLARLRVEVDYGSEFRYRRPILDERTLLLAVTQSGETVDTLAAMEEARERGIPTIAVVNVIGSQAGRLADGAIYMHAGLEIGVAATKTFTSQMVCQYLLALYLAQMRGVLTQAQMVPLLQDLAGLPNQAGELLADTRIYEDLAARYFKRENFLYLGRGVNYPIALEGALKLKEISYIHAEGYPAGEMKHGPIALIDERMPVVAIALQDHVYDKMIANIEQVKARGGTVIALASQGDEFLRARADHVIYVPRTSPLLTPVLTALPMQLLAYHIAVRRGADVDQPRNLAKSVTVE